MKVPRPFQFSGKATAKNEKKDYPPEQATQETGMKRSLSKITEADGHVLPRNNCLYLIQSI
jgi:hypothetical protein